MRLLDLSNDDAALEKHRRSEDQNRAVHQHRAVERNDGIDQVEPAGRALFGGATPNAASLHQRGVEVQIVRHHRGAQDADRNIKAVVRKARDQTRSDFADVRTRKQQFDGETPGNDGDQ